VAPSGQSHGYHKIQNCGINCGIRILCCELSTRAHARPRKHRARIARRLGRLGRYGSAAPSRLCHVQVAIAGGCGLPHPHMSHNHMSHFRAFFLRACCPLCMADSARASCSHCSEFGLSGLCVCVGCSRLNVGCAGRIAGGA
jgi:hypothetical protein